MWRWSIWRFWLSHIRNHTTMGRYSVGERQMTITFHTGRYSGSLDSELEHDDYELKLTRTIVTITVTEKMCEYTRGRWIESSGCFLKMEKVTWSSATTVEVGVYWEDWRDLRWWPRRSMSECIWDNVEIPGAHGVVFCTWNTALERVLWRRILWGKEFRYWENQICGNGSAQSVFLIGGSVFVYKCIHLSSKRVWDAADTGA